jgi:hypothetical protein
MHKPEYLALSPGDRKVAIQLYRVFLVVYLIALVLLGAFATTSAKLFASTAAAGPTPSVASIHPALKLLEQKLTGFLRSHPCWFESGQGNQPGRQTEPDRYPNLSVGIVHGQLDALAVLGIMRRCRNDSSIFSRIQALRSSSALHRARALPWHCPKSTMRV